MMAWMASAMAFAALLGVAARAAESAAAATGRPRRGIWAAALVASVLLPGAALLAGGSLPVRVLPAVPAVAAPPETGPLPVTLEAGDDVARSAVFTPAIPVSEATRRRAGERPLLAAWATLSLLVLLGYAHAWAQFRRARRGWRGARLCEQPVLLARDAGPAVYGLRRASIVVPEWVATAPARVQRLIVLHEAEHARAGDHVLLALAPLAVALLPWNLPLWWLLHRLRLAVELDCDRRVLARGVSPREYGGLLLDVAGGAARLPAAAVALAEPPTFLERRIVAMSTPTPHRPLLRAAGFATAALVLALGACQTVAPLTPREAPQPRTEADAADAVDAAVAAEAQVPPAAEVPPVADVAATTAPAARARLRAVQGAAVTVTADTGRVGGRYVLQGQRGLTLTTQGVAGTPFRVTGRAGTPATVTARRPYTVARIDAVVPADTPRVPVLTVVDGVIMRTRPEPQQPQPLIVLDGVVQPARTRVEDVLLAAEDIVNVEVIKGAAATALYGERGQHGVIAITTRAGAARRPPPPDTMPVRPRPGEPPAATVRPRTGTGTQPLFIVDGVVVSQEVFEAIPAADIESVEVLKGAAAATLYGTRATAGVAIIVLRKRTM